MYLAQYIDFVCCQDKALSQTSLPAFVETSNGIACLGMKNGHMRFFKAMYCFCCLTFIFLTGSYSLKAQQESNYAVHANIIYHFTKYIDWPSSTKSGNFIIGVTGDTPLYDELKKGMANKTTGGQRIVVKRISSGADTYNCHILFISEEESRSIKKIISRTTGAPVLLVSESEGLAQKGSCINFTVVADHLKLEINKNNIEQRGLSIASELLALGKIVK